MTAQGISGFLTSELTALTYGLNSMDEIPDHLVVLRGSSRTIAYAQDATGKCLARDFLESKSCPKKDKSALYHAFKQLASEGRVGNEERFKKERDQIWCFKSYQIRIGAFQQGSVWFLTHGFVKKRNRVSKQELDRADRIRSEHLARRSGK